MYHRNILVEQTDPELWAAIQAENARQEHHIELIASENYASPAVMAAQGTQLTNKYAEGYPGRRYYGGCEHVDVAEQLAIDRVKQIFGADAANVQPHRVVQGNLDPRLVVVGGAPMRQATQHILDCFGQRNFIFNLGHGFVPETPPEHVDHLVNEVHAYSRRLRQGVK